jgi:hypothetical protein
MVDKEQFIFIDDSGDPGLTNSSSSHFIIAAVVVVCADELDNITKVIDEYRNELGWAVLHEFKFNSTKKTIIVELINRVNKYSYTTYAMVLDKKEIPVNRDIIDKDSLYYFVIKELLLKLDLESPVISIDGRIGRKYIQKVRTYLRKKLNENGITDCKISFFDSRKNSLIQFADIVVGSIARSYQPDKTDNMKYKKLLEDKIVAIYKVKL